MASDSTFNRWRKDALFKRWQEEDAFWEREEQSREVEEKMLEMRQRAQEIREGKIHGRHFMLYTEADLELITDTQFLYEMLNAITPCAQPETDWEFNELRRKQNLVSAHIDALERET